MQKDFGSKYMRFIIDPSAGSVQIEDLMVMMNGIIDLPTHNLQRDKKEYCYQYLTATFPDEVLDENFNFPVYKYDHCQKKQVAKWGEGMFAAQETQFITDPNGKEEDDGLLVVVGYRMLTKETALFLIDPKTMTTVQEFKTPFPLAMSAHASFWPGYDFTKP